MTPSFINPNDIEQAINAQWQVRSPGSSVRASLFNLVIYAKKDYRDEYLQKIASNLLTKFPCRVIFITEYEETTEKFLRTYISDLKPTNNSKAIYDIINIEVTKSHIDRIPSIILPHILADRPLLLLWGDDPSEKTPISLRLENYITRMIFDSETASHLTDFSRTLLDLNQNSHIELGDLNWGRIDPWRKMFSHTFNTASKLKCIKEAKDIQILYNKTPAKQFSHNKIQSVYFQAYLAVILGWKFESALGTKEEIRIKYTSPSGPLSITLSPGRKDKISSGRIIKLEILSYQNDHMVFERGSEDPQRITIMHTKDNHCEMPMYFLFDKEVSGKSMIQEIYSQGTKETFIEVLKLIADSYPKGLICS